MKKLIAILIIIFTFFNMSKAQLPTWEELGRGANALNANGVIASICSDSNGNVYAAGEFTNTAGYFYVAKWNGTEWQEVKSATSSLNANGGISKILIDKNGYLYAAGGFTNASTFEYVAKWDGNEWTELGGNSGPLNANAVIRALTIDENGNMYAAGWFTDANGKYYVAKWNGNAWNELGDLDSLNTQPPLVSEGILALCNDNTGNVFAAGGFIDTTGFYMVEWNGSNWTKINTHLFGMIFALGADNNGNIYAGTGMNDIPPDSSEFVTILKWDGTAWSMPGYGNTTTAVYFTQSLYIDTANNVYAGGSYIDSNGYSCVAKLDGTTWSGLGPIYPTSALQLDTSGLSCIALLSVYMDHSGNLYAGGQFTDSNGKFFVAKYIGDSSNIAEKVPVISGNGIHLRIYPNPANDLLNIEMDANTPNTADISLYDLYGRKMNGLQLASAQHFSANMPVSQLPDANYFLKVNSGNSSIVRVVTISH